MKVVWSRGDATVRDVYEALLEERKIAYTTVMTMMNVLEKKGHLRKKAEGRSFLYRPTRPQQKVVGSMVREFVERVFGGSAGPLLAHLVEDERLDARGARRPREAHRGEAMSALELALRNLAAWSVQVAVLGLAAAALARLFPVERPAARLAFGQVLLAVVLGLPARPALARHLGRGHLVARPRGRPAPVATSSAPAGATVPGRPGLARRRSPSCSCWAWRFGWPRWAPGSSGCGRCAAAPGRSTRRRGSSPGATTWRRTPRFLLSDEVGTPATFGLRRPSSCCPRSSRRWPASARRPSPSTSSLHARRGDWPALMAEELLKAVLFFHPVVHWLVGRVRLAREQTVDAEVVRRLGGAPGVPRVARRGGPVRRPRPRGPGRALPSREPPPGAGGSPAERGLHVPLPHRRPPRPDRRRPRPRRVLGHRHRPAAGGGDRGRPDRHGRAGRRARRQGRDRRQGHGPGRAEDRPQGRPGVPGRREGREGPGPLPDRRGDRQGRGHQGRAGRRLGAHRRSGSRSWMAEEGHARRHSRATLAWPRRRSTR